MIKEFFKARKMNKHCANCGKKLSGFRHYFVEKYIKGIEDEMSCNCKYSKNLYFCNENCREHYCLKMSKIKRKLW